MKPDEYTKAGNGNAINGVLDHHFIFTIVADDYPSMGDPSFVFVKQLAEFLTVEGCECRIVAPQSIMKAAIGHVKFKPRSSKEVVQNGGIIRVLRPYTISFSNTSNPVLKRVACYSNMRAIKKGLRHWHPADVTYCYFWHNGLTTASVLRDQSLLIVQASEQALTIPDNMNTAINRRRVDGVVCASQKNLEESVTSGLMEDVRSRIVLNGYNRLLFYKMSRESCRENLGLPVGAFIVGFVGGFIERKGMRELCEAIDRFDDVYAVFIGKGPIAPTCKNILFSSTVDHEKLVYYLNAVDIFVLPTKAEGCCNAIIEALACGLPVVSSNKSFNNEILDETCSIMIDEGSVDEISNAIRKLKNDVSLREKMSEAALVKASNMTIDRKAKAVIAFVKELGVTK